MTHDKITSEDIFKDKKYVREQTVSEITKVKLPTLRNHRHLGRGLPFVKFGRTVLYDVADVLAYLEAHKIRPE